MPADPAPLPEIRPLVALAEIARTGSFSAAALVAGLQAYNEFMLAVTFIQSSGKMPVSTAFFSFQSGYTQNYTLTSAGGLIMVVPVLIAFLFLQRRFIEGYTSSGMTG